MKSYNSIACLLVCLVFYIYCAKGSQLYPTIWWVPDNPVFNSSTGYTEEVTPFSKICLVCPNPATITRETNQNIEKDRMFENMWIVDKHSYDTCTINQSIASNKLLLNCDTPSSLTYYTIVFQIFSPITNEVLFQPGETYYIISTSDGQQGSLASTSGGHCSSHNMKVAFKVCDYGTPCRVQTTSC